VRASERDRVRRCEGTGANARVEVWG